MTRHPAHLLDEEACSATDGRFEAARKVADAVIYEGYVLYPYRASAQKNQIRWQFGVLAPRPYSEATGAEPWAMQTECLLDAPASARLWVQVRFLRVRARVVKAAREHDGGELVRVPSLDVGGRRFTTWDESTEHQVDVARLSVGDLTAGVVGDGALVEAEIVLDSSLEHEELCDRSGRLAGHLTREQRRVNGRVEVSASKLEERCALTKLRVRVENLTDWSGTAGADRDEVVRRSLVAVHVLAGVDQGRFVSLLDPPPDAADAVASCVNIGGFPVLAGAEGGDDVVLSSPIILYDHPQIAPESQGDMFDATEIDEILALRILTLTEDEKQEARSTDDLAASIIDRCDAMPPEIFERLHGAIRSLRPTAEEPAVEPLAPPALPGSDLAVPWWDPETDASVDPARDTISLGSIEVGKGTKVRLRPTRRADAPGPLPLRPVCRRGRRLPRRRRRRAPRGRTRRRPRLGIPRLVRPLPLLSP